MGRVNQMWQCGPDSCGTGYQAARPLSFAYDWVGNLTQEVDNVSGIITYGRSIAGEVTSITNGTYTNLPYNPPNLVSNVVNGPHGPVSYTLGNGLNAYRAYDSLTRLVGAFVCNGPAASSCSGGIQIYGNAEQWRGTQMQYFFDTLLNQQITYGYGDGFNRVTQRTVTSGTVQNYTYAYDRYGNRVSQTALQTGYNFNPLINAVNNHITTSGYLYDAAGNMTNDSVHAYSYDAEGNITKVDGGSTAQYVYDVFNHRIPTLCNNDPESDLPACPVGPPPGTTSGCVSSGTQGCIMNPNPPLNPGGGGGGGPTATTGSSTATAAPSNPHCSKAGLLPSSVGFSYGGTADIGGGPNAGSAGTAGAGAGYFYDSNASSFGAFAGGGAAGYAGPAYAGLPSQQGQPFAFGAYAGAGPSVWFSNAHTAQQLAGPFTTYSLNAGGGPFKGLSIQLSTGGGIWQLSIGLPIPFSGLSTPALAFDELTTTTTATHAGCVQ